MTDEEILKAFECCCGDDVNGTHCKDCPAEKYNFDWCSDEVLREMVVYIKRLKAENAALRERLEKAVELPCVREMLFRGHKNYELLYEGKSGRVYSVLYYEFQKDEALARLAELKGGEE